jgi:hypothetical protein
LTLMLAGCLSSDSSTPQEDEIIVDETPPMEVSAHVVEASFGWAAAVGVPTTGMDAQVMSTNAAAVDVPEHTARLLVEATWSCASPTCTLRGHLYDPTRSAVEHPTGDGSISIEIMDPATGEWLLGLHADSLAAQVEGTIVFTLLPAGEATAEEPAPHHDGKN